MTNLIRWEPFVGTSGLRSMVDRLFGDTPVYPWHFHEVWGDGYHYFPMDIYQTKDDVVVVASLPGFKPEDLDISLEGDLLTIKGEFKKDEPVKEDDYFTRERHYGSFCRSITLPVSVKPDKVETSLDMGILTLRLPKVETIKAKSIKVKPLIEAAKK